MGRKAEVVEQQEEEQAEPTPEQPEEPIAEASPPAEIPPEVVEEESAAPTPLHPSLRELNTFTAICSKHGDQFLKPYPKEGCSRCRRATS